MEQIAGEEASVQSIYPPGVDAHTYEPTSKELTSLANGDAFFYLGAGMEAFAETAANALEGQDISFIEIGAVREDLFRRVEHGHGDDEHGNEEAHEHEDEHHDHGNLDPHIALDPQRMIGMGEIVTEKLIALKPESEAQFTTNFEQLKEKLTTLDQQFQTVLEKKKNKQIIVTHAAYGYWEERYGIEQISISGLSSSDEPSQKELTAIAKRAKEENLHYVIFEQNSSNKVASIIQDYIGAEKLSLHNVEVLTEEDIANGEDYLSIMEKNLEVLDRATN